MSSGHAHPGAASHVLALDDLARGGSAIHALDARAKILPVLAAILVTARSDAASSWKLALLAALALAASRAAGTPLAFLLRRSLVLLPFAAFFALTAPLMPGPPLEAAARAGVIVAKAWTSLLLAVALAAVTPWHDLLDGLTRMGVPRALAMVLHFTHRYVFVLWEEVRRLRRARDARLAGPLSLGGTLSSGGAILGALFLRTLERTERIEAAMAARGFTGEWRTLGGRGFEAQDALALALGLAAAAAVALA